VSDENYEPDGSSGYEATESVFNLSKDATLTFAMRLASTAKLRSIGKMTELWIFSEPLFPTS
jgi:hypothetical protein